MAPTAAATPDASGATAVVPPTPPPTSDVTVAPGVGVTQTVTVVLQPTPELTNEERWREQQIDREVFPPRVYVAQSPVQLLWYDPLTGQSLEVGTLLGAFTAQAHFVFRPQHRPALEVPYRIDHDFGLTAISPAVKQRMQDAGYGETVEAYILVEDDRIRPQS